MKKLFSIPVICILVSVMTFLGYSYLDDDLTGSDNSPAVDHTFETKSNSLLIDASGDPITAYTVDVRNANIVRLNDCDRTIKVVSGGRPIYAGDFDGTGTWYVAQNDSLLTIDTSSGAYSYLGAITGAAAGNNLGMTWDFSSNTMYLMRSVTSTGTVLYTLNLTTRVATEVGLMAPTTNTMIDLACNNEGDMYSWSLSDSLYSVNKSTGATTLIGPLGVNINFAQGGDFDPASGRLIIAGYIGGGVNNLYELNLSTGAAALLCAPPAGEYDGFAIAGTPAPPGGNVVTVCRDGLNIPIPDNGGNANHARDTIVISGVPSGNEITQMTVTIDSLPHTWVGDIRIWIEKVGGPVDTVISRIGLGTGAFPGAGNSCNDFINTNLVDSAAFLVQGIQDPSPGCGNGAGQIPANGYFKPKDPLTSFTTGIDPNGTYIIHISDNAGADIGTLRSWCLTIDYDVPTNTGNNTSLVNSYKLHQNYPNPFNPTTKIKFDIPKQNFVSLKIYDISGREVASLINGQRNSGSYEIEFDGSYLASGTYFYRIQAGDFVEVKKMVLLK